jgi:hypothetical protein
VSTRQERAKQARVINRMRHLIEDHFPDTGSCGLCGDTTLGARHRIIEAIASLVRAGEHPGAAADEFGVSLEAVAVALAVTW